MAAIKLLNNLTTAEEPQDSVSPLKGSDNNCLISKGTTINGDFRSAENIRLDGKVEGTLHCDNRLVVGQTGTITGDVQSQNAVISGKVEGNVQVDGTLQLTATARIKGDLQAKFLAVEEGAVYDGKCVVGGGK